MFQPSSSRISHPFCSACSSMSTPPQFCAPLTVFPSWGLCLKRVSLSPCSITNISLRGALAVKRQHSRKKSGSKIPAWQTNLTKTHQHKQEWWQSIRLNTKLQDSASGGNTERNIFFRGKKKKKKKRHYNSLRNSEVEYTNIPSSCWLFFSQAPEQNNSYGKTQKRCEENILGNQNTFVSLNQWALKNDWIQTVSVAQSAHACSRTRSLGCGGKHGKAGRFFGVQQHAETLASGAIPALSTAAQTCQPAAASHLGDSIPLVLLSSCLSASLLAWEGKSQTRPHVIPCTGMSLLISKIPVAGEDLN